MTRDPHSTPYLARTSDDLRDERESGFSVCIAKAVWPSIVLGVFCVWLVLG